MSGFRYLTDEEMGPNLRRLRRRAGLTQAELAEKSGREQSLISAIERGLSRMTSSDIIHFSIALSIRSEALLSVDPEWERFMRSAKTPAEKRCLAIFEELIQDYLGLEALVGDPDRPRRRRERAASLA